MRDVNSYMWGGGKREIGPERALSRPLVAGCLPTGRQARRQGAQYNMIIHGRGASLILFRMPSSSGKR